MQEVRNKFSELIKKSENAILSQGEMLLIGFYGLFEDVSLANENVIKMTSKLKISTAWKTVDQIREAKSLLVSFTSRYFQSNTYILLFIKIGSCNGRMSLQYIR